MPRQLRRDKSKQKGADTGRGVLHTASLTPAARPRFKEAKTTHSSVEGTHLRKCNRSLMCRAEGCCSQRGGWQAVSVSSERSLTGVALGVSA